MSWSKRLKTLTFVALSLGGAAALAGCTLTPVYSGAMAESPMLDLAYARPDSRLEQVIYQELALRLGRSDSETTPLVTVTARASNASVARSVTANPAKPYESTVTATLTMTARNGGGRPPLTLTRTATAAYTTSGQVLADRAAADDAAERAGRAVAESLRLAVLASLAR